VEKRGHDAPARHDGPLGVEPELRPFAKDAGQLVEWALTTAFELGTKIVTEVVSEIRSALKKLLESVKVGPVPPNSGRLQVVIRDNLTGGDRAWLAETVREYEPNLRYLAEH
jgi:hypothetical protein